MIVKIFLIVEEFFFTAHPPQQREFQRPDVNLQKHWAADWHFTKKLYSVLSLFFNESEKNWLYYFYIIAQFLKCKHISLLLGVELALFESLAWRSATEPTIQFSLGPFNLTKKQTYSHIFFIIHKIFYNSEL